MLHDIGWMKGQKGHHKTSLQMIMEEDRLPFSGKERTIVANVARYHRGAIPVQGHKEYEKLKAADRTMVDRLASLLRVADALDVSHASVIRSIECRVKKDKVFVILGTTGRPDRELEKAQEKKDLFEKTFKRSIAFEWVPA